MEAARQRTGISSTTKLIEYALANLAIGDEFSETFKATRGTIDPKLTLGFERD